MYFVVLVVEQIKVSSICYKYYISSDDSYSALYGHYFGLLWFCMVFHPVIHLFKYLQILHNILREVDNRRG